MQFSTKLKGLMMFGAMLFSGVLFSQTTISGTVVDENGGPVPGANVVIVGTSQGAVADFDGNFTLSTDQSPPFTLRTTSIGFTATTTEVTSSTSGLNIVLNESSTILDEIVISASRTPERVFESPVSVERFGLKDIQNTTAESFYGGLQNLKGVDINTNSLTFQSINTRGFATFANNRFLQLVDGMDNQAPGLNFVLGNLVGMSELDVQSVEILPGASSALYGAGAFNGILFMRSKSPFDFTGISAYAKTGFTSQEAAGDHHYYDVSVRAAHKFSDKLAAKVTFSILEGEDWYAINEIDIDNPSFTRTNPNYNGLNVYGDEVSTLLNFDVAAGLPTGTVGSAQVSRTGYLESDLVDYDAQSVKTDFALHYRPWATDLEFIYQGRIGRGNTIYQGANRYAVNGFTMQQHKLEVKNDNFFLRGYVVSENAGDSYDTRFTGININSAWKSNTQWFTEYAGTYIPSFLGALQMGQSREDASAAAHATARNVADTGRLLPGTPEFQAAFNSVISNPDLTQGSRFVDNTKFRHVNGNYNIAHLIDDWADIQIGGSWRQYELNSGGTIFTDITGPIEYDEYGAYIQGQKKILDERLKITLSGRYDKNDFFDGFISPRAAVGVTLGERRNHNLRASVQQGFRNPTTQDLFIGLNAGAAILVGSAPDNLDRDVRNFDVNPGLGQVIVGGDSVEIVGRQAYENSFTRSSVEAFAASQNPADLAIANPDVVEPEEITAFEVGYRSQIGKFTFDISGYYNSYKNFITNETVLVPLYGDVGFTQTLPGDPNNTPLSIAALANGDFEAYQTYTNADEDVNSYGAVVGVDVKLPGGFDLGANYTFTELDFDQEDNPDLLLFFNTPEHKVKASFGHTELFENFGFGINYRWSDAFEWEATFATGDVPAFHVLDAQINYTIPKMKSVFKFGGSNILGDEYFTAVGSGLIGSIFYVSWTVNP